MGDVYQAEKILDTKLIKGKRYFYIKWLGWDDKHNTWEPKRNIIDTRLIDFYFKSLKKKSQKNDLPSTKKEKSKTTSDKNSNCYDFSDEDSNETDISSNLLKTDVPNKSSQDMKESSDSKITSINTTKVNSTNTQQDALRSAIREAGGLRPIVKQSQQNSTAAKLKKANASRKKISDDSESESAVNDESVSSKNSKELCKINTINNNKKYKAGKRIKISKRRKISSSRSFSSSTSSLVPIKKRQTSLNKIKYSDDDYEDYNSNEEDSSDTIEAADKKLKKKKQIKKESNLGHDSDVKEFSKEKYRTQNEIFTDENENDNSVADSSFDDSSTMLTMISNSDDVFVTDVTSGVVTVTIKECISMDGFFKKRDAKSDM